MGIGLVLSNGICTQRICTLLAATFAAPIAATFAAGKEVGTLPTMKEHEAVLRTKCRNGTLYRNDEKLATWLAIHIGDVPDAVAELVSADVLRLDGYASSGAERYKLGLPSHLSDDARRLYRVMLSKATATDVVNVTTVGELAQLAGMDVARTRSAFHALSRAHLVTEDTFDDRTFPVILRRCEA